MFQKKLSAVLGVVLFLVVSGAPAQDKRFKLVLDVAHMGKAAGSPTVIVREGVPGSVEVSGQNGYRISFVATDAGEGKIKFATTFASPEGTSSPTVILNDGQSSSMSDGRFEFNFVATRQSS